MGEGGVMRWLRASLAWREVRRDNHWIYAENTVTGARRVRQIPRPRGWMVAPYDAGWVHHGLPFGEMRRRMGPPPRPTR